MGLLEGKIMGKLWLDDESEPYETRENPLGVLIGFLNALPISLLLWGCIIALGVWAWGC